MIHTFDTAAIYVSEGAKFKTIGVGVLQYEGRLEVTRNRTTHMIVHLMDQVGKSFSRARLYTESPLS